MYIIFEGLDLVDTSSTSGHVIYAKFVSIKIFFLQ